MGYRFQHMPKLIMSGSFDPDDEYQCALTIVDDPFVRQKCAGSSVIHQWGSISPQKNASLIHLIALGAHETTGPNRNGDSFKRAFLQKSHPSFIKHGALYRNHKNKDYSKRDGEIIKTAFNDDMDRVELLVAADHSKCADWLGKLEAGERVDFSMGFDCEYDVCLVKNTKVLTRKGPKSIEDIREGDEVLSHTGAWRSVRIAMVRNFKGRMVNLNVGGVAENIVSTHNHPFYVIPQEGLYSCHGSVGGKKRRHTTTNGRACKSCKGEIASPQWVEASKVKPGDYVAFPVSQAPRGLITSVSATEAAILGFYAGDGCLRWGKTRKKVRTTPRGLSITLDNDHPEIQKRLKELGRFLDHSSGEGRDSRVFNLTDPLLAQKAKYLIGEGSFEKTLSLEALGWTKEAKLAFLGGYLDTDGSVDSKKGSARINTCSESLASTVFALCVSLGIAPAIHKEFVVSTFTPKGVWVWVLHFGASYVQRLVGHSVKARLLGKNKRHKACSFFAHGCLWMPVKEVGIYEDEVPVFNMSVDVDESYTANLVTVHNCSICGNEAPTRKEYCKHVMKKAAAPYGMGRILPDGRKCYVDNPQGVFNDISKVPVGADMTAQSLRKVAGLDEEIIGGADLAESMFPELGREKFASKIAVATKLSKMEKLLPMSASRLEVDDEKLDEKTAAALREMPAAKMFGELAKLGCVLPFNAFFSLVLADRISEFEPHLKEAEKAAGQIFSHISEDDELMDAVCSIGHYECERIPFPKLGLFESDLLQDRCGLHEDIAEQRMVKAAMTGTRRVEAVSPASLSKQAMGLLSHYAAYKVAALESGAFVLSDRLYYVAAALH